jgi:hypothetical protein
MMIDAWCCSAALALAATVAEFGGSQHEIVVGDSHTGLYRQLWFKNCMSSCRGLCRMQMIRGRWHRQQPSC